MEINERIKAIIKELYEGSTNKFAEAISVKPSVVSGYTGKRQSKPSYDVIERIVANANISPDWLITGEGSMLRQHPKEELEKSIANTTALMKQAAKDLDFMQAAQYRDEIIRLQKELEEKG